MGSKRSMILVVALLIGSIAAFALYNYVNGVEDKALQGTEQVTVYWVQAPISANTQGEQVIGAKMIVTKQVPANLRPPTAITDLSTIKGKVAKTDLAVGQIVVPGMFVDQSQAASTWLRSSDQTPVPASRETNRTVAPIASMNRSGAFVNHFGRPRRPSSGA